MSFKNKLQHNRKGSQSVTEYMFFVKRIDDELYVIDHVISNDDVTLYVLNGLSAKYRDILHQYTQETVPSPLKNYSVIWLPTRNF